MSFHHPIRLHIKLYGALPPLSLTIGANNLYMAWIMHFCDFHLIKMQQDSIRFYIYTNKYTLIPSPLPRSYWIHFLPYQSQNSSRHHFSLGVHKTEFQCNPAVSRTGWASLLIFTLSHVNIRRWHMLPRQMWRPLNPALERGKLRCKNF